MGSFGISRKARGITFLEELDANDVGVAAHRAIFGETLQIAAGAVDGDDDLLAAVRTEV